MSRSLHTSSSVVSIKSTVNIQMINGLLRCYSIVKNTLKIHLFDNFHHNKYKSKGLKQLKLFTLTTKNAVNI